jgi:hypothetical protein
MLLFFLLCLLYFVFSERECFSAPICFDEVFYLFALVNLSTSKVYGLLRFYVGIFSIFMLFIVNFYVSMTFFASNNFSTFLFNEPL